MAHARMPRALSADVGEWLVRANDGLAFVFVVLALYAAMSGSFRGHLREAVWGVLGAVAIGAAIGYAAGRAVMVSPAREDVDPGSLLIFTVVLGVAALGVARLARTDAILAVFVAGLSYNAVIGDRSRASEQLDDALTRYLVLPLFFLLGVEVPWRAWRELGWPLAAFVVAVLVLRRLPVVLLLKPALGLPWRGVVFLGWFGPVGVSALFYLTYSQDEGVRDPRLWAAGSLVVAASTVVYGVTAMPGRRWYARRSSVSDR
ncbi:cation:proton antiporter [Micromonospora noduli]|uniref:cation:proton antiporter domain-containing protein n=1 Tax=Micromonospora noduli TaxID=709876 RepID=UPI003430FFBA